MAIHQFGWQYRNNPDGTRVLNPVIEAVDVIKRLKLYFTRYGADNIFGDRIFQVINETRVPEVNAEVPYCAVVHTEDNQDFNYNPNEIVYRVSRTIDVFHCHSPDAENLRGSPQTALSTLVAAREIHAALNGWIPNTRYRPVQQEHSRWLPYLSTARATHVNRFLLSYLIAADETGIPEETSAIDGADIDVTGTPLQPNNPDIVITPKVGG